MGWKMITDSMSPTAGPRYVGLSFAGIIGNEGPIARRHRAVVNVFKQLETTSVVNIQAPPFSGKSSLAFLLAQEAISRQIEPFLISLEPHTPLDVLFPTWCGHPLLSLLLRTTPTFVILDDSHSLYGVDRPDVLAFWSHVKSHQMMKSHPVKLVFLSTLTKAATERSPHVFETKLGADVLRSSREDVNEMFDDYDQLSGAMQQPPLSPFLRDVLWRYCSGHFGILRVVLYDIFLLRRQATNPAEIEDALVVQYLLSEEFNVKLRSLRIPYQKKSLSRPQIATLLRAMSGSFRPRDIDELAVCDELVNIGLFTCVFDVLHLASFEFASPALRHVVRNDLLSPETRPSQPPSSLIEFVLEAVQLLKVFEFLASFSMILAGGPQIYTCHSGIWQST
jgi:hypothetical protein